MGSRSVLISILVLVCTVFVESNAASIKLSMRNLAGCFDFVWEPECDTKIHILWKNKDLFPEWRVMGTTSTIPNNNNPSWTTEFPIPSDASEFKFEIIDVDIGIDDLIGYTRIITLLEILTANPYFEIPIGGGEGSGVLRITKV